MSKDEAAKKAEAERVEAERVEAERVAAKHEEAGRRESRRRETEDRTIPTPVETCPNCEADVRVLDARGNICRFCGMPLTSRQGRPQNAFGE